MCSHHHLSLVITLLLTGIQVTSLCAAESGYLRTVGPPALRFANPAADRPANDSSLVSGAPITMPPTNAAPPPVLSITNKPAPASAQTAVATNPPTTIEAQVTGPAPDPAPSAVTATPAKPEPALPSATIQGVMPQPQLFLQYFTPDYLTNSNGYGVVIPVTFQPPQPTRSANSSATYQITPAEKP